MQPHACASGQRVWGWGKGQRGRGRACTGQEAAIQREGKEEHSAAVTAQHREAVPRGDVPHRNIRTPRCTTLLVSPRDTISMAAYGFRLAYCRGYMQTITSLSQSDQVCSIVMAATV